MSVCREQDLQRTSLARLTLRLSVAFPACLRLPPSLCHCLPCLPACLPACCSLLAATHQQPRHRLHARHGVVHAGRWVVEEDRRGGRSYVPVHREGGEHRRNNKGANDVNERTNDEPTNHQPTNHPTRLDSTKRHAGLIKISNKNSNKKATKIKKKVRKQEVTARGSHKNKQQNSNKKANKKPTKTQQKRKATKRRSE